MITQRQFNKRLETLATEIFNLRREAEKHVKEYGNRVPSQALAKTLSA